MIFGTLKFRFFSSFIFNLLKFTTFPSPSMHHKMKGIVDFHCNFIFIEYCRLFLNDFIDILYGMINIFLLAGTATDFLDKLFCQHFNITFYVFYFLCLRLTPNIFLDNNRNKQLAMVFVDKMCVWLITTHRSTIKYTIWHPNMITFIQKSKVISSYLTFKRTKKKKEKINRISIAINKIWSKATTTKNLF